MRLRHFQIAKKLQNEQANNERMQPDRREQTPFASPKGSPYLPLNTKQLKANSVLRPVGNQRDRKVRRIEISHVPLLGGVKLTPMGATAGLPGAASRTTNRIASPTHSLRLTLHERRSCSTS
jgi:hypothetical protein